MERICLRKALMWRIFDVDGGEVLLLNWHADDAGLLTQSADVGGFFCFRLRVSGCFW